ncbi:MAG: phosphoribosylformylglycinamidine synthase subunit PurQ [Pseudomonadota bacterium]
MKTAVIVFPGSNCDRDMAVALGRVTGQPATMVWHKDTALPAGLDMVAVPGGFSFGDYLRVGAIAAQSPIMRAVADFAARGGQVLGICNGWQVLIEAGLLPGALMRNATLKFVCRDVYLTPGAHNGPHPTLAGLPQVLRVPVAHHDGCFVADEEALDRIEGDGRVAFRYVDADGHAAPGANPNGSLRDIAGVLSENGRVLGMMPHPERLADDALGGSDGRLILDRLLIGQSGDATAPALPTAAATA